MSVTDGTAFSKAVRETGKERKGRGWAPNETDHFFKVMSSKRKSCTSGNHISLESEVVKGNFLKISHL